MRINDPFYEKKVKELRKEICNYVIRNPGLKRREILSAFSWNHWVTDLDPIIDSMLEDGMLRIDVEGIWDVILFG